MNQPLPRWSRRYCQHPLTRLARTTGGRVLREVCRACGAELGAVAFDSAEDALDALRDAAQAARAEPMAVDPRSEPPGFMLWEPVTQPGPYGASIPSEVLEMRHVVRWPRRRNRQ
jgi:hypothetical protein